LDADGKTRRRSKSGPVGRIKMEIKIIKSDGYGLLAEVEIDEQCFGVMDDFSMIPPEYIDYSRPELSHLTIDGYPWEMMFNGNPNKEKKLVRNGDWTYNAYGQITSICPVVADFGLFTLELGNFTTDQRCVGEWIVEKIDRLILTFRTKLPTKSVER
jgi:hypothetical protein